MQLLMDNETEVLKLLGQCFQSFHELPELHPSDRPDFIFHIHALQNIVMSRAVERTCKGVQGASTT